MKISLNNSRHQNQNHNPNPYLGFIMNTIITDKYTQQTQILQERTCIIFGRMRKWEYELCLCVFILSKQECEIPQLGHEWFGWFQVCSLETVTSMASLCTTSSGLLTSWDGSLPCALPARRNSRQPTVENKASRMILRQRKLVCGVQN